MTKLKNVQDIVKFNNTHSLVALWNGFETYENECTSEYVYKHTSKLVFSRPDHESTRQLFAYKEEDVTQPFIEMDLWIKQKILELKEYLSTLEGLEALKVERTKTIERKNSFESKLSKLKERPGKEREVSATESELFGLYKEVENMTAIINISVCYMSDIFLPLFKRRQLLVFYKILERLFKSEAKYEENLFKSKVTP